MPVPSIAIALFATLAGSGDVPELADYFGFSGLEVIPVGDHPGPMITTDIDGDGLIDIVVANNHRSRIEILRQKAGGSPDDPIEIPRDINEFPDHWQFERVIVPVADAIKAMATYDLDQDGLDDLITAGDPGRIVFLKQTKPGSFRLESRRDIPKLAASPSAFAITDFSGDGNPQLLSVVSAEPVMWPLQGFSIGTMKRYPAGAPILAVVPADYDGDGLMDLAGISPDDPAPIRIWFGRQGEQGVEPGPQTIFEMPPINEFEAIERPGTSATDIAVIERNAHRIVLYHLNEEAVKQGGDRDASFTVYGFPDPGQRKRAWAVVDADGDGRSDVIAADTRSNALSLYRQAETGGLMAAESSPSLSDIDAIASVPAVEDRPAELLVLSTEEGIVGRTPLGPGTIPFPNPLPVSAGHQPVAMNVVLLDNGAHAAIVSNKKRDYMLDLVDLKTEELTSIDIGSLSRKPDHIDSIDVDQDGRRDILILTRDRPMMLLLADPEADGGFKILKKEDMGQYGLVDAAGDDNTAALDVNADGAEELLIANGNFVRAVRFERSDDGGEWRVVRQFNADDPDSELISVTPLDGMLVASDKARDRVLVFASDKDGEDWRQSETLRIRGFAPGPLAAGHFSNNVSGVLTVGEDGFAVIPLGGTRRTLEETASWKSSLDDHVPHELAVGDVNADGYGDMVALDAGEQMMELFTFDKTGTMLHATGFQIYESRLFHGGNTREFQPRQIAIADVTGDGAHDIVMLIHDRIIVYPQ
ncbi:MAG: VCBS repeat-containing protein [Planctomycetes bacterium]|nr:VCBS repeat-containing protein [Planctomycetota bacterium]